MRRLLIATVLAVLAVLVPVPAQAAPATGPTVVHLWPHGCSGTMLNAQWLITVPYCVPPYPDSGSTLVYPYGAGRSFRVAANVTTSQYQLIRLQEPVPGVGTLPLTTAEAPIGALVDRYASFSSGRIALHHVISNRMVLTAGNRNYEVRRGEEGGALMYQGALVGVVTGGTLDVTSATRIAPVRDEIAAMILTSPEDW